METTKMRIAANADEARSIKEHGFLPEDTADMYWWYADNRYHLYTGKPKDENAIPTWSTVNLLSQLPISLYDPKMEEQLKLNIRRSEKYGWDIAYVNEEGIFSFGFAGHDLITNVIATFSAIKERKLEKI